MKRRRWKGQGAPDVDVWDAWLAACGRSPATRSIYVGTVRRAARAGALASPDELVQWLSRSDWSVNTRATYTKALRQYLVWARARGWRVPHERTVRVVRQRKCVPKPLSASEVVAVTHTGGPARTHQWVRLAMATGLRAGELARLRGEDVDLVAGTLRVRGKGARTRVVPLHVAAVTILASLPERGPLWPGVRGPAVSSAVHVLFRRAGISGGIHRCRHWHATSLLDDGVDLVTIQQQLGHASVATTQMYLAVRPERQREAVARLTIPDVVPGQTVRPS